MFRQSMHTIQSIVSSMHFTLNRCAPQLDMPWAVGAAPRVQRQPAEFVTRRWSGVGESIVRCKRAQFVECGATNLVLERDDQVNQFGALCTEFAFRWE